MPVVSALDEETEMDQVTELPSVPGATLAGRMASVSVVVEAVTT